MVICLTLILALAWPSTEVYAAPPIQPMTPHTPTLNATFDGLQSLFVLMIIAAVEVAKKQAYTAHVEAKNMTRFEKFRLAQQAAVQTLDDPNIWAGFAGHISTAVPVAGLSSLLIWALLRNVESRGRLVRFLQSGLINVMSTAGWVTGQQVLKQARDQLHNQQDFERAAHSSNLLAGVAHNMTGAHSADQAEDQRVANELAQNVFSILYRDPDQRREVLRSVWNSRIAESDFVSETSITVAAGFVGSLIFPRWPKLMALIFGVTGGTLAYYFPNDFKDALNDGIVWSRRFLASTWLERCEATLADRATAPDSPQKLDRVHAALSTCEDRRNSIMTIQLGTIYRNNIRLQTLVKYRDEALSAHNPRVLGAIDGKIEHARYYIREAIRYSRLIYGAQIDILKEIEKQTPDTISAQLLDCEHVKLENVLSLLNLLLRDIELQTSTQLERAPDLTFLEIYYEEGFIEQDFISSYLRQINREQCRDAQNELSPSR